jgi:hypothetical protein
MTPKDRLLLESRLRAAQPGIADEVVRRVLAAVSGDTRAREIALRWARLGQMPTEPDVEGLNPASLIAHFKPSVVLTALPQLFDDPQAALETFRHPPPGWTL